MNRRQLIATWIGILIIVFIGACPPWTGELTIHGAHFKTPASHYWIWDPPGFKDLIFYVPMVYLKQPLSGFDWRYKKINGQPVEVYELPASVVNIDVHRLLIYWISVSLLTAGIVFALRKSKL